jgi:hypothetical protein
MNREQATKLINTAQALGSANGWNMLDKLLWLVDAVEAKALAMPKDAEPVAVVDANDDGYFAEILPDRDVKIGQNLYAHPPQADAERVALLERIDAKIEYWQIGEPSTSPTVDLLSDIRAYLGGKEST